MAYSIRITDTAKNQLAKADRPTAKRIDKKLREVAPNPFQYVSKAAGLEFYKLRVGDYRILMSIQRNNLIILVVEISHRRTDNSKI
ncbi:type II toxin-antitoxin system RelE/ParE family toxin [Candidatus Nitrosotenuis chungbukensis]|uniref:type II toxin-antitoxin system RelE family toxin n=1 Tax=Candidatus Nitrosotenuis chungbukensis TaxID=1353246 RepID=UPI002671C00B|nr:type II toxin-antitoxin system RelE/ParE family toxin [Candidatus Nitrosotenuis chungbukensis]WKT57912.1 type II toxin-antitoxin system RelE/ParE family toxin [Candidatus Nitrosotenuis chungbukensis]